MRPYIYRQSLLEVTRNSCAYLANVDTSVPLAKCMSVTELGDDRNWVETRILSERCGDDLERVRIRLEAVRFHALESVRVLREHS